MELGARRRIRQLNPHEVIPIDAERVPPLVDEDPLNNPRNTSAWCLLDKKLVRNLGPTGRLTWAPIGGWEEISFQVMSMFCMPCMKRCASLAAGIQQSSDLLPLAAPPEGHSIAAPLIGNNYA